MKIRTDTTEPSGWVNLDGVIVRESAIIGFEHLTSTMVQVLLINGMRITLPCARAANIFEGWAVTFTGDK